MAAWLAVCMAAWMTAWMAVCMAAWMTAWVAVCMACLEGCLDDCLDDCLFGCLDGWLGVLIPQLVRFQFLKDAFKNLLVARHGEVQVGVERHVEPCSMAVHGSIFDLDELLMLLYD